MFFITILSCVFDGFIIMNYYNHTLSKKKSIHPALFYLAFLLAEAAMNISTCFVEYIPETTFLILNVLVSSITIFLLSLLYEVPMKIRLLLSTLFILLTNIADDSFSIVISSLFPNIMENMSTNTIILGGFCVEMILFILSLILILFWNRKNAKYSMQYNIIGLSIPVASLVISFLVMTDSLSESYETSRITAIRLILLIVNICYAFLLDESFQYYFLKSKNNALETELLYQKEKYLQISSSYRNIRKIVHDTKKHYFSIMNLVESGSTDRLKSYLDKSIEELESTYAHFNTGNLIIDSYLSYYSSLFHARNINFSTNINLDINRLCFDDYDLSIILGNLLDNGYNATTTNHFNGITFLIELYMNENHQFIIHTLNPSNTGFPTQDLEHGYGLNNVKTIVDKYNGILDITDSNHFEVYIVLPLPLDFGKQ